MSTHDQAPPEHGDSWTHKAEEAVDTTKNSISLVEWTKTMLEIGRPAMPGLHAAGKALGPLSMIFGGYDIGHGLGEMQSNDDKKQASGAVDVVSGSLGVLSPWLGPAGTAAQLGLTGGKLAAQSIDDPSKQTGVFGHKQDGKVKTAFDDAADKGLAVENWAAKLPGGQYYKKVLGAGAAGGMGIANSAVEGASRLWDWIAK